MGSHLPPTEDIKSSPPAGDDGIICKHERFQANCKVGRLHEEDKPEIITEYRLDVEVHCMDCLMPFIFVGVSGGYSPGYPTVNFDGTELRAPIKPV